MAGSVAWRSEASKLVYNCIWKYLGIKHGVMEWMEGRIGYGGEHAFRMGYGDEDQRHVMAWHGMARTEPC